MGHTNGALFKVMSYPKVGFPHGCIGMIYTKNYTPHYSTPSFSGHRREDNLMPEADFLARNISPVTFRVVMPDMPDKPEWKLHGQTIAVTLPLSDPISALKARLFDETGMQAGKQKLQMENIFFKDTNTLAYYNIYPATVVHLQVKERGGRKK